MKPSLRISLLIFSLLIFAGANGQYPFNPRLTPAGKGKVNIRVDNMGYWKEMVRKGYAMPNPYVAPPEASFGSSIISGDEIRTQDSPDIPTTGETSTTQSENSVALNPNNEEEIFNSNNSTTWNGATASQLYGSDHLFSEDAAMTWGGSILYAGDLNFGDPVAAIGLNGRHYCGKINNNFGQSMAWSDDKGITWHEVLVATVPSPGSDILDKNHMTIDNCPASPFAGYLYDSWTAFVNEQNGRIEISRSTDNGEHWSTPIQISQGANAVSHDQGVNVQTGPNGEVYAAWAVYDTFPGDEAAIGFARSLNGGTVFMPAVRIIDNIRGIRNSGVGKSLRVNSFPSMAVDISGGSYDGAIYVVWANTGQPGINTGADVDVYMIRSFDDGSTWSAPIRVNQDPPGLGKKHFFPWITCDPDNGNLAIIYYDDRNTTSFKCETYISYSYDAGESWSDLKVSDVTFTPSPIPGLAASYFGDYLGITSKNRKVYPVWTDNRTGKAMSYISPVDLGPAPGQAFVVYDSHTLTEIGQGGTAPGLVYGDSLYMNLGLRNLGDQPASAVTAYLSSPSPYVVITDSIADYGDFAPDELKTIPSGFSFKVSDTIPDNLRVRFNIRAVSTDTTWLSHLAIRAMAPGLKITGLKINDTTGGNGNARLDAGETVVLRFTIANTGDYSCDGTWERLSTNSASIQIQQDSAFTGSVLPGTTAEASFTAIVSDEAPFGSWVDLTLDVFSGKYQRDATFIETIGAVVEDFETGNFSKYPWTFGGNAVWNITNEEPFEGTYSAKSRPIFDMQTSTIKIDYTSGVADSISFWMKTSSEPSYDFLNFYIDDVRQGQWSGEIPWTRVSYPTLPGSHIYKWTYEKDIFYQTGQDCGWIDYIEFPPPVLPGINAGPDDTICGAVPYHLNGEAADYDSIRWTTSGDGTFNYDTIPDPVYTPGPGDVSNGIARLLLTAWGNNGSSSNAMFLHIGTLPPAHGISFYPNDTLCAGQVVELFIDTISGGHYLWIPGGDSTPVILLDTTDTGGAGTFKIKAYTSSALNCTTTDSLLITFKDCTGIAEHKDADGTSIFPNPFSNFTTIKVKTKDCRLDLTIFDPSGKQIKKIFNSDVSEGYHQFTWDGRNDNGERTAAGIYQLVIRQGEAKELLKIIYKP